MKQVIGIVLAGGHGKRLYRLTDRETKPALIFGGKYRIIDMVMNNLVHSEIAMIKVLVQAHSQSLIQHVGKCWTSDPLRENFIDCVPAQMKVGGEWYRGTADAVYQNLDIIRDDDRFSDAAIFAGDQIFIMDVRQMYTFHQQKNSVFTIAAIPVPVTHDCSQFGVIRVNEEGRVMGFIEKSSAPPPEIPGKPGYALVSMGNYLARIPELAEALQEDAEDELSAHDFGKDVIPKLLEAGAPIFAYDFSTNSIPGVHSVYWEDVGTLPAYLRANIDLTGGNSKLDTDNPYWPLRTFSEHTPPAKVMCGGELCDALISGGCVIDGGRVTRSVLSHRAMILPGAELEEVVTFPNVVVGRNAKIRHTILHKKVRVPDGMMIGYDVTADRKRGFFVGDGVTIVTADMLK